MFDISCVGIVTADVLAKPVEALPPKGLLLKIDQMLLSVGGCAANAAVDLARLGASVQIFGKVGRDNFGRFVRSELQREGVDVHGLLESSGAQTSASIVTIGSDGERSVLHCFGANAEFTLADIDISQILQSKILFIAGTFLMPEFDGHGAAKLLKTAREKNVLCCLDTAWDPAGKWLQTLEPCLPLLDWFMPSLEEAVQLSGKTQPEDIAEVFQAKGVGNVIIKLGNKGCYVKPSAGVGFFVPTFADVPVVDTSGAGDSFCAGFIMGLTQGWKLERCAQFANAVGTHCIMETGATAGIKSMSETLAFMDHRM